VSERGLVFDTSARRLAPGWLATRLRGARPPAGGPLTLRDIDPPQPPGPDWVPLRPRHAGICGSDVQQVLMRADADNPLSGLISFPHVMGHEIAAQVAEDHEDAGSWVAVNPWIGCAVRGLEPCPSCRAGSPAHCVHVTDPVLAGRTGSGMHLGNVAGLPGGFATRMVAHRSQCVPLPAGLEPAAAVLADPLAVGLHAVCQAGVQATDGTALVLGAGTIGLCVAAALRERHPHLRVLVSAAWSGQVAEVRELGAEAVPVAAGALVDVLAQRTDAPVVRPWLGRPWLAGGGVDTVIDAVGSAGTLETALRVVRPRGRVVRVGVGRAGRLQSTLGYFKEVEVAGSNGYGPAELQTALELLAEHRILHERWRTHTFPLDEWRHAFEAAATPHKSGAIKVSLDVG
jgi:threonine dehydrogenase-like Zn-dependent dehydrogenase